MTAIGGSMQSVSMRGRLFPVAADADTNLKIGGFEADVSPNGDGSARKILIRVPWSLDGIAIEVDHNRDDLGFLQEIAAEKDWVAMTFTYPDDVTYQGRGSVVGEVQGTNQAATATITLSGPGQATQQ